MATESSSTANKPVGNKPTAIKPVVSSPPRPLLDASLFDIDGRPYPLTQHAGSVVLLVNVASQCGLTPQYVGLEKLYQTYRQQGLVIIGIPANNFGAQEPGSAAEIKTFCSTTYQVTFPLMSKISVKGPDIHPLYRRLVAASGQGDVEWNFAKFIVGRNGMLAARIGPQVTPDSDEMKTAIEQALAAR